MPQHLVSGDTAGGSLGGTYPNPSVDFDTRLVHWVFDGRGVYDPNMSGTGKVWDGGPAYNNDFNTMFVINALTVASGFWMLNVGSAATGSYQLIEIDHPDAYVFIVVGEDSNVLFDTSAIFLCTDMSQLIFLALGGNSRVDNDTVDGTVGTLVMGVGVGSFYGGVSPTFAGYSGTLVPILGEKAALISYDNATSGLTATTVQTAIDEIADDSDVYTPTNVSADRSYDANSTTLDEIADVLGTLIADLQDRGIIG